MLYGFMIINNIYLIIGSNDQNIKVFDINNSKLIRDIKKHSSYILGIKPVIDKNNNKYFVSYGNDKNIYLWSLNHKI